MQLTVRPYDETLDHPRLVEGLRAEDRLEYVAAGIWPDNIGAAIGCSLTEADKAVALDTDKGLAAVAAVSEDPRCARWGIAWVVATPLLTAHPKLFLRPAKAILDDFSRDYGALWNVKYAAHTTHIRWLRRMGFVFIDTNRQGFHTFVRISP